MQCYTGHELVPTNTDWSNIEGITGRKDRGPQVAGGNKLQAADGFFLLYTHTHTHTHKASFNSVLTTRGSALS